MNIHKILLVIVVLGLTACGKKTETVPFTPGDVLTFGEAAVTQNPLKLRECVAPSNPDATDNPLKPGCYTVCATFGEGAHTGEPNVQLKALHVQVGDGVEIRPIASVTNVLIRAKAGSQLPTGGPRPDEIWPLLGDSREGKLRGPHYFVHSVGRDTKEFAHVVQIGKTTGPRPATCTKPNLITIDFCNDMTDAAGNTIFVCGDPGGDQGHAHAEN